MSERRSRWLVMVCCLACLLGACFGAAETTQPASGTIETLMNAPHGLTRPSGPDVQEALDRVLRSPDRFIPLLAAATVPDKTRMSDTGYRNRIGNALGVVYRIGGERGEEILAERFRDFDRLLKDQSIATQARGNVSLLRNGTLESLGTLGSDRLVESVLGALKDTDVASYHVYMKYLQDVARGNPRVAERVGTLSTQAGRENWPITRQTLQALASPSPAQTTTASSPRPMAWAIWYIAVPAIVAILIVVVICWSRTRRKS